VDRLSIRKAQSDAEADEAEDAAADPEKASAVNGMVDLWNALAKQFVTEDKLIQSLGLCDLDTDVFKLLYSQAQVKPTSVQVVISITLHSCTWVCSFLCFNVPRSVI
jgi:diketogulonate reductase-like aldo/keto reductase